MKIATVVGTRPEFIQSSMVSRELRARGHTEILIHTGQHYNDEMSQVFFDDLEIPRPDKYLGVGSGSHAEQTGWALIWTERALRDEKPDWVLVYGDTNSTLAGALAAVKLRIPIAHVEAGMRSFNREMPEEHNRVLVDHCADLHLCPTKTAVWNLWDESFFETVERVGDVMYDAVLHFGPMAQERSRIVRALQVEPKKYLLATVHRVCNTDNPESLAEILGAFGEIGEPIVFPVHPRTRPRLLFVPDNVKIIEPVGYFDMLVLEQNARLILTDSGGVQKEAYFFSVPCVTLRKETEWVETVGAGWNVLVGADKVAILDAVRRREWPTDLPPLVFGHGDAAHKIVQLLEEEL
jgi:UDP-GlcNAc3NAcA epimerase